MNSTQDIKGLPEVSIVVPLYNEELSFDILVERLDGVMKMCPFQIECVLVDDGSKDSTGFRIKDLALRKSEYTGVILSKNHGHPKAISAGMAYAKGTFAVMIIDGDLQDPPELLVQWQSLMKDEDYDVIYGVRQMRNDEGVLKKYTSKWFYRLLNKLTSEPIPLDSGDFCLMSRRVVDYIILMPERYRFIRGMRASLGFKQLAFEFERQKRVAGTAKYTFKKSLKLSLDAIYGFSEIPYTFMLVGGAGLVFVAIIYLIFTLIKSYLYGTVVSGFMGLLTVIILIGGVNLLGLGILGGYIVRNFFELKKRPLFIVDEIVSNGILKKESAPLTSK